MGLREVERTFEHDYDEDVVTLTVEYEDGSTEEITATGNHPFWVADGDRLEVRPAVEKLPESEQGLNPYGAPSAADLADRLGVGERGGRWTEARWLRRGDHFLTRTGKSATVVGLTVRPERVAGHSSGQ